MQSVSSPISLAGSQLNETRHVCAFFNNDEEEYRIRLPFIKDGLREYCGSSTELRVKTNLISVVDDDACIRRTTTFLIESFGFRAAAFESAEEFLKSGQQRNTSCLILDVRMPNMNGLQLQRDLAAARCSVPIIFITAYEDKESRKRAMQAGAVAFLGKPFSDEQLLETLRSAVGNDKGGTTSM